jgi:hypothetical protein
MFPAGRSNQITYLYYCTLLELGRRKDTQAVLHRNGKMFYYTYHLTSVR